MQRVARGRRMGEFGVRIDEIGGLVSRWGVEAGTGLVSAGGSYRIGVRVLGFVPVCHGGALQGFARGEFGVG